MLNAISYNKWNMEKQNTGNCHIAIEIEIEIEIERDKEDYRYPQRIINHQSIAALDEMLFWISRKQQVAVLSLESSHFQKNISFVEDEE